MRPAPIAAALAACLILANCAETLPTASAASLQPDLPSRGDANPTAEAVETIASGDVACLAEAIYFEARGTSRKGQEAVAHVVLNRTEHPEFPGEVCAVISDRCQFSYRCNGRPNTPRDARARAEATRIASDVLSGAPDPTGGALFFHSVRAAATGWFRSRPRVGQFGGNVFYR